MSTLFALGALSHCAADNNGHPMAVNRAVPLFYPKLGLKFGKLVTYTDDPFSHAKTEFAFDVFQAAKGRYASAAYKSFIGFEVAKPVLEGVDPLGTQKTARSSDRAGLEEKRVVPSGSGFIVNNRSPMSNILLERV